jgi:hypothetical protein
VTPFRVLLVNACTQILRSICNFTPKTKKQKQKTDLLDLERQAAEKKTRDAAAKAATKAEDAR